jgi:hypothetical protein
MVLDWHVARPGGGPPLHSTPKPSWIAGHALPVRQALRMLDQAVTDYIDAWIAA